MFKIKNVYSRPYSYFIYFILQNVVIDACILENESGLLQQVCEVYSFC